MGQITTTRNLVATKVVRHAGQKGNTVLPPSSDDNQGWVSSGRNLFLPGHPEKSGRNLFLPVLSGQNWKKLGKTVKDVRNAGKK